MWHSTACGSWLACDAGGAVRSGRPLRYHRGQARSHNDPACRRLMWLSTACGSWLACDAGDAVCSGKPRRCHRGQARSHNDPACRRLMWHSTTCGSWLACDAGGAVRPGRPLRYHRGQARPIKSPRPLRDAGFSLPGANQRSSKIRSMRRNGSAAPHSNWSPTVKAPRNCEPMFNLRRRPTGTFRVPVTLVGLSSWMLASRWFGTSLTQGLC